MVEDKDFIGKIWPQNCGDDLLVIEKTKEKKGDTFLFKGIFQKYFYEIFFLKQECLSGKILNPLIEQKEFIEKLWPQSCGDNLKIIEKTKNERGVTVWKCQFVKMGTFIISNKRSIKNGQVDLNIVGCTFLQNCGDTLKVIEKTTTKNKYGRILYKCIFQKYSYEIFAVKDNIIKGKVINPQIEQKEFIEKLWPQNCGDTLKIIKKVESDVFECEFQKYSFKLLARKSSVLLGKVLNPEIERIEFVEKLWPQNCGDILKVIEKTNKKEDTTFLWKCQFLKYPSFILATKKTIKLQQVENPALPWKSKESLEKYIRKNFKNDKKPTLLEVAQKIGLSSSHIGRLINKYQIRNLINYKFEQTECEIRSYIQTLGFEGKNKVFGKEFNFQEIDIYIPERFLGIEFNGNYWHSDKNCYKKYFDKNSHQKKSLLFKEKINVNIFHIFEYEWETKQEILKSLLKTKLGIFNVKIGARQCKVRELTNKEYQNFCNENHLQGEAGAKVKFGLFYKNELVQIMSFGIPRFTEKFDWEIIRECSKLGYFIIGGKQRLWKYFVQKYNPDNCISYCDFSKFTGKSYLKLGFCKKCLTEAGFVWWENKLNQVFWRNPYKNQEFKNKGYAKIYDCGQLVFEWYNKK